MTPTFVGQVSAFGDDALVPELARVLEDDGARSFDVLVELDALRPFREQIGKERFTRGACLNVGGMVALV
jgi:hypothetical protein